MSKRRRDFRRQPPRQRLGDQPIEAEYHEKMTAVAQALDEMFNGQIGGPGRTTGFVLMVFPFEEISPGGSSRCNYVSNGADRRDIVTLMKEMIARFEGQPEISGRA
jgi:hypothetical protein